MRKALLLVAVAAFTALGPALPARAELDTDGVPDASDNCPTVWNRNQEDRDDDGLGDVCDDCRFAANPSQADSGGTAAGDACECGDVEGSGGADVVDAAVLRRAQAGLPAGSVDLDKCPVESLGAVCDASALAALRTALTTADPVLQVCPRAVCTATCNASSRQCRAQRIALENQKPGATPNLWDVIDGADDPGLLGFATDISYAAGATVSFKIHAATATSYDLRIFRLGWYGGKGARLLAILSQGSPTSQPACGTSDPVDCNWAVTDQWTIPTNAVSGVYLAKLVPDPPSNGSHVLFVVRDDVGHSDILFRTDDSTWQAYNPYPSGSIFSYGVNTGLYNGASRVSYDRPIRMQVNGYIRSLFGAQYQMIRFLERNGYDVSYSAAVDTARSPAELLEHRVFLSSGHDEYWSGEMRDAVNAARDAGVDLVFLSGNLMFWKTRWENGFRTMVGYKTTQHNANSPSTSGFDDPAGFTGTWRDVRWQDPGDLAEPENSTTGLIFGTNGDPMTALKVPGAYGPLRLWRNTAASAPGTCNVTHLAPNTLGFEWDHDEDNGHRPAGLFRASSTNFAPAPVLYGSGTHAAGSVAADAFGQSTHHVATYRAASGAFVFDAGSVQWSLGLVHNHLPGRFAGNFDPALAQATANVLADMGVQPDTPLDFCPALPTNDVARPDSQISSPGPSAVVRVGAAVEILGSATDVGGQVAGVEVSTDGGTTWHPAEGRASWHYTWRPSSVGAVNLKSRAVDDSGNLESSLGSVSVSVGCASPCSVWPPSATPAVGFAADSPVELGLRFRADVAGAIRAIRFWADASNPGPHAAHLFAGTGTLLASATAAASSVTGWREAVFAAPVPIAPHTTYVAAYHASTGYAYTHHALDAALYRQPLAALAAGGVFAYGSPGGFPTQTFQNTSYFVDVDFVPSGATPRRIFEGDPPPAVANHFDGSAAADPWGVELGVRFRSAVDGVVTAIRFYRASDTTDHIVNLWRDLGANHIATPWADQAGNGKGLILESGKSFAGTGTGWHRVPLARPVPIVAGATYVASYHARDRYAYTANYFAAPVADPPLVAELGVFRYGKTAFPESTTNGNNYWVDVEFSPTAQFRHHLWTESTVPGEPFRADPLEVELGVRFTPEVDGFVDGVRFYKHPSNGGVHSGTLWTGAGAQLRTATFLSETPCGWQQVLFGSPAPVTAGATYVASYHTTAGYAYEPNYLGAWSPPLRGISDFDAGVGMGRVAYGPHAFPAFTANAAAHYWVDVVFRSAATPAVQGPTALGSYPLP